jgi:hypothetical protein
MKFEENGDRLKYRNEVHVKRRRERLNVQIVKSFSLDEARFESFNMLKETKVGYYNFKIIMEGV